MEKTRYPGVFTRRSVRKGISYYIRYRYKGEAYMYLLGSAEDGWNAAKASKERERRIREGYTKIEVAADHQGKLRTRQTAATVSELFYDYLLRRKMEKGESLKGEKNMSYCFEKHLAAKIGAKRLNSVQYEDIYEIKKQMLKAKLSAKTIANVLSMLISVQKHAQRLGIITGIDFSQFIPKNSEISNHTRERLELTEMQRLMRVLENEPIARANVYYMAMLTGMRRGEIAKLTWDNVNWREKELTILFPKSGVDKELIPLNEDAIDVLRSQAKIKDLRNEEAVRLDRIFFNLYGMPFTGKFQCLDRWNKLIRQRAELPPNFRLMHGMRHQFGTVHAEQGTPIPTLQMLMRHEDIKTTMKYIQVSKKAIRSAADNTSQFMGYKE